MPSPTDTATRRPQLGVKATSGPSTWVQTERKAHEAWAKLIATAPKAAMLLHHLVARMGNGNAVVVSQQTLAGLMGVNVRTVQRAVAQLRSGRWLQTVQVGQSGTVNAYIVNSMVAWGQPRDQLHLAHFSAVVVANAAEQPLGVLEHSELRRIPVLFPGEQQLPTGSGEEPPSQPAFDGLEPDLPALSA
jgi:hypothetical protein